MPGLIAILWAGQVCVFLLGLVGPWRDTTPGAKGRLSLPVRVVLSASLVAVAFRIAFMATGPAAAYARLAAWGMTASFVGDLLMARVIPFPNRLIGGMLAFAVGHALYVAAYVDAAGAAGVSLAGSGLWVGLIAYEAFTLLLWAQAIRNPEKPAVVNGGALAYGLWIGVMAACALALATTLGGAWWLAALGALSFVVSDALIAITDIGGTRIPYPNDWIWLTYLAGQMGIVYAPWVHLMQRAG
jgi:hypothetical protein